MARKSSSSAKTVKSAPKSLVQVKSSHDVAGSFNRFVMRNMHDRYHATFSKQTKERIVAYGPWLAVVLLFFIVPEFVILSKTMSFIAPGKFIETILFSRQAWVLLILFFVNCLAVAGSISELFQKSKEGWNRIYLALLLNTTYVFWQLLANLDQPAAPLLSLVALGMCVFTLLDVREYYK